MSNVIYEKSLKVANSALDRGQGFEMAENHLFAAIAALADSPVEQNHLRRRHALWPLGAGPVVWALRRNRAAIPPWQPACDRAAYLPMPGVRHEEPTL